MRKYIVFPDTPSDVEISCKHIRYSASQGYEPCLCTASSLGAPLGRLQWLLNDQIVASGDYGFTELEFPTSVSARENVETNMTFATCRLDWVEHKERTVPVWPSCATCDNCPKCPVCPGGQACPVCPGVKPCSSELIQFNLIQFNFKLCIALFVLGS